MSSFGAIPIDMITGNIDYLCSSANKNLRIGISFVVAKKSSLELIKYYENKLFILTYILNINI